MDLRAPSHGASAEPSRVAQIGRDAALRNSEIRYRRLFEAARDGVLILDDSRTRKITDANPFMTELLGYSHQELLGKELFEIGLLGDAAASQAAFAALESSGYIRYDDLPLQSKNGELREVEFVSNVYYGYALPEDQERAAEAGFNRHLAKPADLGALERVLSELPERHAA